MVPEVVNLSLVNPFRTRVTGGSLDIRRRAQAITAAGFNCTVFAVDKTGVAEPIPPLTSVRLELHQFQRTVTPEILLKTLTTPWPVASRHSTALARKLAQFDLKGKIVVIEGLQMGSYLDVIKRGQPNRILLRMHNIESEYHFAMAKASRGPLKLIHNIFGYQYQALEKRLGEFDELLFVSVEDMQAMCDRNPSLKEQSKWVPPIAATSVAAVTQPEGNGPFTLCYFGDLQLPGNIYGIEWFIKRVWPSIRESIPGVQFLVAGHGSERFQGPGIVPCGFVDDLEQFLRRSDVMVIPLHHGSGVKIKFIDALGLGLPVIATSVAAQGTHFRGGELVPLCDEPHLFAQEVLTAYRNPGQARRRAADAVRVIERYYSARAYVNALGLRNEPTSGWPSPIPSRESADSDPTGVA